MKRPGSSDSLGALISMCPTSGEHGPGSNQYYSSMLDGLDEEGCIEEYGHTPGKKRRLSLEQVKALEKYFEVENKLEPERKVKLAKEIGLQPRQVAVWFQNRRARWKTKQLERDYGLLKANFDSLNQNYESLQHDKDDLLKQIKELKSKLNEENKEINISVKDGSLMSDFDINTKEIEPITPSPSSSGELDDAKMLNIKKGVSVSESELSDILNEDNNGSPNASNSSCGGGNLQNQQQQLLMMSPNSRFNCSISSFNCLSFTEKVESGDNDKSNVYQPELVKLEEQDYLSGEEACNFFSDEVPPTLPWYCPDQWT